MSAPRWAAALLRRLAPPGEGEDLLGDMEEVHGRFVRRRGCVIASLLTGLETLDLALALLRDRIRRRGADRRRAGSASPPRGGGRDRRPSFGLPWLDVKVGLRMLVKHPAMTLAGSVGMAVAFAFGTVFVAVTGAALAPLPFEEGDRIVALETWDLEVNNQERHILHDFLTWRRELDSVDDLGAYRTIRRNLITPDGSTEPIPVAEMTASGFRLARVAPLLGRPLVEEDEREGAPPVIVIGHDVWRRRFGADPGIVGRDLRLGNEIHTVVGVMPEGFAFPMYHRFWVPFRADPSVYERRQGPGIRVFGRLAPGASLEGARAELTTLGRRATVDFPETHERLRPRIVPYTAQIFDDMEGWEIHFLQVSVLLLLVVICVNIAILVYARTVTRRGEIAVRSALGASRRRVVGQLFVEALVLSAGAAAVGLLVAYEVLRHLNALVEPLGFVPFWMDFRLSSGSVAYALALTVLATLIVGVLPALKATGRRVYPGLQRLAAGASGLRLGRTWTTLIVVQVAAAVAVLPTAAYLVGHSLRYGTADPGFSAETFLTARLGMDRQVPPSAEADAHRGEFASRYGRRQAELVRRLDAEPSVSGVTFALDLPGEEPTVWVEVEGVPTPEENDSGIAVRSGTAGHEVGIGRVDVDLFDVFDVPILTGREFRPGDLGATSTAVIVNRTFAERITGDGEVLGRRLRYLGRGGDVSPEDVELGRWYQVVGVVSDFPNAVKPAFAEAKVYHPLAPGEVYPVSLALRIDGGAPSSFSGRLRELSAALDPTLRLHGVHSLDEALREEQGFLRLLALTVVLVTVSVLLLSSAGIYALMSFTVSRRRREIGIRTALGAHPRRILASVFSRALGQLTAGIAAGVGVAGLFDRLSGGELTGEHAALLLPSVAAFMMAVGLLAALGPARRGLRIQPTEALKEE